MKKEIENLYKDRYTSFVKISSRLVGGNKPAAEDIVQEAFTRALTYHKAFNPKFGTLLKWFNSILFRCVKDYQKEDRLGGMVTEVKDSDATTHSEFGTDNKTLEEIWAEVELLTGDTRHICFLYFIRGYKPREIVEVTNFKNNSVRTAVKRFNKQMKEKYNVST